MKKRCTKCKLLKGVRAFYRQADADAGRKSQCKICTAAITLIYYQANKERLNQIRDARVEIVRDWLIAYKRTQQCKECGFSANPVALDFHHRDPTTEKVCVSSMWTRGKKIDDLKKEIAKCDVYCANCHRILHYKGLCVNP